MSFTVSGISLSKSAYDELHVTQVKAPPPKPTTGQEMEQMAAVGKSVAEIAAALGIPAAEVDTTLGIETPVSTQAGALTALSARLSAVA